MSDDQKKQGGADDLKAKLGVGGAKLPGALPGIGGGAKAPLPGVGGPAAGKAPLPGIGGAPAGGKAPLPGVGAAPVAAPPFMQQPEPEPEPQGPSAEEIARDPFGHAPAPSRTSRRPSLPPGMGEIGADAGAAFSEGEAGRSRKPLILAGVIGGVLAIFIGYLLGTAKQGRVELNIAIRDALIVEYEIQKAGKLFSEVQTVANMAFTKASKMEYEESHVAFLTQKVRGNPVKPTIFTERNYKKFDPAAVQWLMDYNDKWSKLDKLIQDHRMRTKNDEAMLKASKEQFTKLLETSYGAVFTRVEKLGNQLVGNLVVMGVGSEEGKFKVQADVGTYADERELYNPEGEDSELTKEPDKYVIPLGEESKRGLLQNASLSHFKKYQMRLKEITDLMKGMNELQTNLLNKLSEICSQDPVPLGGPDPLEQVAEYKARDSEGGGEAAPAE